MATKKGDNSASSADIHTEVDELLKGVPTAHGLVDVSVKAAESYVPLTKRTVCYIVCGVVFNDQGEVLMMQEAKSSCYGMWYLPAGRLEPGESLVEGAQREMEEETGITFDPTTLLCVEAASGVWYRFTFTGKVTGGSLKTPEEKDSESLQARWCPVDSLAKGRKDFPLRAPDILQLIDIGVKQRSSPTPHPDLLPTNNPHTKLLLRLLVTNKGPDGLYMLVSREGGSHIPVSMITNEDGSLHYSVFRLFSHIFGQCLNLKPQIMGVLAVEHVGKPEREHDGICISLLLSVRTESTQNHELPQISNTKHYEWVKINESTNTALIQKVQNDQIVKLLMLR